MQRRTSSRFFLDLRSCIAWMSLSGMFAFPTIFPQAHAQAAATSLAQPQKMPVMLEQGKEIDREISGKNTDGYELPLQAGQFAEVTVQQRGIDVVVDVVDASQKV